MVTASSGNGRPLGDTADLDTIQRGHHVQEPLVTPPLNVYDHGGILGIHIDDNAVDAVVTTDHASIYQRLVELTWCDPPRLHLGGHCEGRRVIRRSPGLAVACSTGDAERIAGLATRSGLPSSVSNQSGCAFTTGSSASHSSPSWTVITGIS